MNKTQLSLVERLEGKHGNGGCKVGWTKFENSLRLQKFNEIDQAYKLAEKYPETYKTETIAFKLVKLIKKAG
jgi:hypothetical protein